MTLDPYAALGIPAGATRADAARAHRRLAKQFHPDVNPGPAAADRMRRINEAWRILSDPVKRARYDADRTTAPWAGTGQRTSAATWATWPESRRPASPRTRRPPRPEPADPSFGDRPAVFVTVWLVLTALFFIGTWLGSVAP
ncbi:MAG TPA: J domain-containing protein [Candidatus Limnocylindria bacterium]